MTSTHTNPRRRYITSAPPAQGSHYPSSAYHGYEPNLRKSSTFHCPTSPPSEEHDPILSIPSLPRRSPTCPRALENAVAAGERRIANILGAFDQSLSGLQSQSADSQDTLLADGLPVPAFMLDQGLIGADSPDTDRLHSHKARAVHKHHSSDSGIGSTVTGSEHSLVGECADVKQVHNVTLPLREGGTGAITTTSLATDTGRAHSGVNGTIASIMGPMNGTQHALSEYACRQIQKYIINPIVQEASLKDFHPLISGIPYRVERKEITCLRDLEKLLLWLAPKWSVSKASFLKFCETSIQCIHTTVDYLNEHDQRRPTDRPYTNGYFLDLTEQVRQYADILAASREAMAARGSSNEANPHDGETLSLEGGIARTGRPLELVRTKDGRSYSLRTGAPVVADDLSATQYHGLKRSLSEGSEDDVMRSMARKRKSAQPTVKDTAQQCSECDKVFKRPCDLTKHEKTHSRPWKCMESSCKYHKYGWPTEKERDRHVNDKHSEAPSMYKCQFHPCTYQSKRESNCKQHMEKAHGWVYVRSKNNTKNNGKKPATSKTPPTPQINTPGSHAITTPSSYTHDAATSEYDEVSSSAPMYDSYADQQSLNGSTIASEESTPYSNMDDPLMDLDQPFVPFQPNFTFNDSYRAFTPADPPEYPIDSDRPSWDASSMANEAAVSSSFATSLPDQDPMFGGNFDWSNMNNDFTSHNAQMITPASSVENRPFDAFSRNPSMSLEYPHHAQVPHLSPGAQGHLMFYSPYSNNDTPMDEGSEEMTQKPVGDFPLFDGAQGTSSLMSSGNDAMFHELSAFAPTAWSGRGTELAHQLGMPDLMEE